MPFYAIAAGETSNVVTAIGDATTAVTGVFSDITGWWFVPVAVGFLVAGLAVSLIAKFIGKRRKGGKRR